MGCFSLLRTAMFVCNGVIVLGGVAVLGVGIWVKLDSGSIAKILDSTAPQLIQLVHVAYLCMAAGSFLVLVGFMGCWGALRENKGLLMLFFVVLLILFIAEVAGAAVVLAFSAAADIFVDHLKAWALKTLKEDYGRQDDITALWEATMKELQCCGLHNYSDFNSSVFYDDHSNKYPTFCCRASEECPESDVDQSKQGCLQKFQEFLKCKGKIVGGVFLGIGALELAAMAVSLTLYCQMGTSL